MSTSILSETITVGPVTLSERDEVDNRVNVQSTNVEAVTEQFKTLSKAKPIIAEPKSTRVVVSSNTAVTVLENVTIPKNLTPYATAERHYFEHRSSLRSFTQIRQDPKNVNNFKTNREEYRKVTNLIRQHKLQNVIIPVKKNSDPKSDWVSFRIKNFDIVLADKNGEYDYSYGLDTTFSIELFSYDIFDQNLDSADFYSQQLNLLFSVGGRLNFNHGATDYDFGHQGLDEANIAKMFDMLASMRDKVESAFSQRGVKMQPQHFASMLIMAKLLRADLVRGSYKQWVAYMVKGFTLPEIIYAFSIEMISVNKGNPVPVKLVREYMQLPAEWVKAILTQS